MVTQGFVPVSFAGSFLGTLGVDSSLNNQNFILHPTGYIGSGTSLTVNLCIVPGTTNAANMVIPVANIAARMTDKLGKAGNLSSGDGGDAVPFSSYDFESVALHEVGHCLGLGHVNAASESGLSGVDQDYTKAAAGVNAVLNVSAGTDTVIGSKDDARGDDVSVHWFRQGSNNPCANPGTNTFDTTTYSVDGALPPGHNFAANADTSVCTALGSPNTEAVMQQGSPNGQAQRFLGHDDEAMLRLAMSGVDEIQGTADDYSLSVQSLGISDSTDCDINLSFDNAETGFAVCGVTYFTSVGGNTDHGRIASADAYFNTDAVTWFFNNSLHTDSFTVGGSVSGLAGNGLVLQNNAGDDLAISVNGGFVFSEALSNGSSYSVTVQTQPTAPNQTCSVSSGSGTLAGMNISDVDVTCTTFCNVNTVSDLTVSSVATYEACEILVAGPDFTAETGASVFLSSGLEIWFMPGFLIEQGATINADVCGQSLCNTSLSPMPNGCHSCVVQICDIDPTCCNSGFNQTCLDMVGAVCGLVCE